MERKPKILLVDDRVENLIALETVLRDIDVELIRATSGNEALKQTLNHQFALALIDIQMPEMDGYELAEILRQDEKTANLPFIFISGIYTDHSNIFKGYEKGAFSFITKPFEPEILINKVKLFVNIYEHEAKLGRLNKDLETKNSELNLLNEELESFTYSVSHDLRAPLRAINGYAHILLEEHPEVNSEEKRLLNIISKNASKMGELIDNLLEFSKLGKREINKGRVDMNQVVQSIIKEITEQEKTNKVTWKIADLSPCYGDYHLLKQVMYNLISNAVKYSGKKEHPEVEIGSELRGDDVTYFVKDNGAGFDMQYADQLFRVFQRLHNPREFEGTGVGLAIVSRIILRHKGHVWAEGKLSEGACFYFSIPTDSDN